MQEISKTITYDTLCLTEVVEKVHEFLISSPMESELFVQEIRFYRSGLGQPLMTVKHIGDNQM